MSFTQTYKKLFEVCIYHHYHLNKGHAIFDKLNADDRKLVLRNYHVPDFISIYPTAGCSNALRKNRLICKLTPSGFIVGIAAKPKGNNFEPLVPLDESLRFTFLFRIEDPFFYNYTSLPLRRASGLLYFFQNRKDGSGKQFPYISQFAPGFVAGQKYSAGDILSDDDTDPGQLFIASRIENTAPPGAGWINDELVNNKPLHYATSKDLLPVYGDLLRFNTGVKDLNVSIEIKDRLGNSFQPPFETIGDNDKSVLLADIHHLPEDYLTIELKDPAKAYNEKFSFYRLAKAAGADAIMEFAVKSDSADYNMIDANGLLLSPVYELRFRNRSLAWRYNGAQLTQLPKTGPNPLTKFGFIAVSLKNDANKDVDLPNPDVRMIKVEQPVASQPQYNLYTETFVH